MRNCLLIILYFWSLSSFSQIHNRLIKLNVGYSGEQIELKRDIKNFNDTSEHVFNFVSKSPIVSYSHEFIFGSVLSVSGKFGFQYFNIYYNNQYFGSPYIFGSINPSLSLIYRKNFEYYIKLQLGVNHWLNRSDDLVDKSTRIFPEKTNIFTGITIGGFNYYLSDNIGLNLELSIWSPELLTFGVSYRFFKGELPKIQELQNL